MGLYTYGYMTICMRSYINQCINVSVYIDDFSNCTIFVVFVKIH